VRLERHGRYWTVRYTCPESGRNLRRRVAPVDEVGEELDADYQQRLLEAAQRKLLGSGAGGTMSGFLDRYEDAYRLRAPRAYATSYPMFRAVAEILGGDLAMREIDVGHAEDVAGRMAARGFRGRKLGPNTVRNYVRRLAALWEGARVRGEVDSNPWRSVKLPREQLRSVPALTLEECDRLIAACPPRLAPFVGFLLETGLRKGEALALRWEDVKGSSLTVRKSKSGKPRTLHLTERARGFLARVPRERGIGRANRIFRLKPRVSTLATACRNAGLERVTFHGLRHVFAVECARAGVSMLELSKILGHASVTQTQRYADHAPRELAAKGIAQLEAHRRSVLSTTTSGSGREGAGSKTS
jgi:integrase